jgi:hypothetical protein
MRKLILTLTLAFIFSGAFSQGMKEEHQQVVSNFISYIKNRQWERLSEQISYPLKRVSPVPAIKNKEEFLKRYQEVFDGQLIKTITNSNPAVDWSTVGWRGIMLLRGDVWLDYDGKLIAVNYQPAAETKKRNKLIQTEKSRLHVSLRNFESTVYTLETAKHSIRIDDLGKGEYRYASWNLPSRQADKSSIMINKGEFIADGTGGNHKFKFRNQEYTYEIVFTVLGEVGATPAMLNVYKGEKLILATEASITER